MTSFILPAILVLLAQLLVYPLAPIAALLSDSSGRLPKLFWWMETHDNPGWSGPRSEGFPSTKWGLCRWLWRNKAYSLRNRFRANPTQFNLDFMRMEGTAPTQGCGFFKAVYRIGEWRQWEVGYAAMQFKLYVQVGWKLKPYFDGHRPVGVSATGIIIPLSIRSDDWDD